MADKWRMQGTLFDACNCVTLCPCNYAQTPTQEDCRATAVWHISKGNYGKTSLDGLNFASAIYSRGNPMYGIEKLVVVVDEKATGTKREALMTVLSGRAGGLWAEMGKVVKGPPEVLGAKFRYSNNGRKWGAKAGDYVEIQGGYLEPPKEFGLKLSPRKVQTFDLLFSPTMEKVVGISETYRMNAGGLMYDIRGRYSSSGKFDYRGP